MADAERALEVQPAILPDRTVAAAHVMATVDLQTNTASLLMVVKTAAL